jgi:murein DD-endopeptidase MepM/ murein hydrolase activator NlpD
MNGRGVNRRGAILALLATAAARPALAAAPGLFVTGRFVQGGYAIGRTAPRAEIQVDGATVTRASASGLFVIGFDRDAGPRAVIRAVTADGQAEHVADIAPTAYDVQKIDGLPTDQVTPSDPALLARIHAEAQRKAMGFASRADTDDFRNGFTLPLKDYRLAAHFGGQRILNGNPMRPHYGDDLAAPIGTPVMAPADAVVAFAESGLHYEGALILLDHGQGLITDYLHLSRIDVKVGQRVRRGQVIGAVGKEGRATGPHLCWRMKWRDRNLDPMLFVGAHAPAA